MNPLSSSQLILTGMILLLLSACGPKSNPVHPAELAICKSKKDSSGVISPIYNPAWPHPVPNNSYAGWTSTEQKKAGLSEEDHVKWFYQGHQKGEDVYLLKRDAVFVENGATSGVLTTSKQHMERKVRFNGRDNVIAWDDRHFIAIRPLGEQFKTVPK